MKNLSNLENLRQEYMDLIKNEDLNYISQWKEPNSEEPTDEEIFKRKILKNIDLLATKIEDALNKI